VVHRLRVLHRLRVVERLLQVHRRQRLHLRPLVDFVDQVSCFAPKILDYYKILKLSL
jgi:hypothetical protein